MSGRVFSISLDDLTFAKLEELKKTYPELSRNGMIRHIINLVHSLDDLPLIEAKEKQRKYLNELVEWMDPSGDKREIWNKQANRRRNS